MKIYSKISHLEHSSAHYYLVFVLNNAATQWNAYSVACLAS